MAAPTRVLSGDDPLRLAMQGLRLVVQRGPEPGRVSSPGGLAPPLSGGVNPPDSPPAGSRALRARSQEGFAPLPTAAAVGPHPPREAA